MAYDADAVDAEQHRPAGLLRVEPLGVDEELGAEHLASGAALGGGADDTAEDVEQGRAARPRGT